MNLLNATTKIAIFIAASFLFASVTYAQTPVAVLSCEAKTDYTDYQSVNLHVYFDQQGQATIYARYGLGISVVTSRAAALPLVQNRFDVLDGITWADKRPHAMSAQAHFAVDGRSENGSSTLRIALSNVRDNFVLEHCALAASKLRN